MQYNENRLICCRRFCNNELITIIALLSRAKLLTSAGVSVNFRKIITASAGGQAACSLCCTFHFSSFLHFRLLRLYCSTIIITYKTTIMKTILFCASAVLMSSFAIAQQTGVKSEQNAEATAKVISKPGSIEQSGSASSNSSARVSANPKPVVQSSQQVAGNAETKAKQASVHANNVVVSRIENQAEKPAKVSAHTNNKSGSGASIDAGESASPAIKHKRAHAGTNSTISTNNHISRGSIKSSGMIKTSTGLGL
jgi:hypothetical protein